MKTKIVSVLALFALLVLGTVLIAAPSEAATATADASTVYNVADPYVQPLAVCTRYCSWCVKYGHGGVCTLSGSCC